MGRLAAAVVLGALAALPCCLGQEGIKGGVLVKNGRQTSCNLMVMNSKAALVAAACLDYSSDRVLDPSTKYEVYLDDRIDGKAARYDVASTTISQFYAAESLSNNFAVLQYNLDGEVTWNTPVAIRIADIEWTQIVYDRCSLTDLGAMEWAAPVQLSTPEYVNDDGACRELSKGNVGALYLVDATNVTAGAPPPGQSGCEVPFGTVYTTINSTTFLLGLYSHTLVSGATDLCRHGAQCSYYPYALQHVGLIASTLGASANFGQAALSSRDTEDRDVDNNNVAANASIATLSGNQFRGKDAPAHSSQATSSDKGAGSSSASDGAGSGGADDHSQRNAVIIAVCTTVGSLLLIGTAAMLAMRHLRRKRLVPDPVAETRAQEILRVDRARASTLDYDLPPLYDDPRR